jgi:hypothetical protein
MRSLILLTLAISAIYALAIAPGAVIGTLVSVAVLVLGAWWLLRALNPFNRRPGVRR